jgi:hypothetical protein
MTMGSGRVAVLAVLLFMPATSDAQEAFGGWRGLKVSARDTIYVTDDTGLRTEGRVLSVDNDSLVMLVDGAQRRFDAARVQGIEKRGDSLLNGALIGAAVGVAFGLILTAIDDGCSGDYEIGICTGADVVSGLLISGAVGIGIDALIVGRTRVYDAGRTTAAVRSLSGPQLAFRVTW